MRLAIGDEHAGFSSTYALATETTQKEMMEDMDLIGYGQTNLSGMDIYALIYNALMEFDAIIHLTQ